LDLYKTYYYTVISEGLYSLSREIWDCAFMRRRSRESVTLEFGHFERIALPRDRGGVMAGSRSLRDRVAIPPKPYHQNHDLNTWPR